MMTNVTAVISPRNLTTMLAVPDDVREQRRSRVEIAVWSTLLVMIIMASLVGNMFVIACVRLHHRLREERGNIFLVNLSVTDMCSAAFVMSGSLLSLVSDSWELGPVWCDIVCGANYTLIIVSMMTLCFISLDRYAAVIHALRYQDKVTSRKIYMLLAFAWFQGLCFGAAPIYARWVKYDYWEVVCAIEWNSDHNRTLTYVIVAFAVCFLSPGVIMVVAYCKVMKVAFAHNNVHPQNIPGSVTNVSELTDFPAIDDVISPNARSTSPQNLAESVVDLTGGHLSDVSSTRINLDGTRPKQLTRENHASPSALRENLAGNTPATQTDVDNNEYAQLNHEAHVFCANIPRENVSRITKRQYIPHRLVRNITHEGNRSRNHVERRRSRKSGKGTRNKNVSCDRSRPYDFASRTPSRRLSINIVPNVQTEADDVVNVTQESITLHQLNDNTSRVTTNQAQLLRDSNTNGEILLVLSDIGDHVEIESPSNPYTVPPRQSLSAEVSLARSWSYDANRRAVSRPKRNYSASSKAVRSLLIVVLAYFICMTPFSITKLYKVIVPRKDALPGYVNLTASIIQYCSSAINPLIYGIFRKDFQSAFILLLKKFLLKAKIRDAMDLNLSSY